MKRRDWKIKKLKKTFFGKLYKRRRIFFLRKLFLRKNLVFLRKNLISNFIFYNKFLNNFKVRKTNHIEKNLINNLNKNFYLPIFFFKKKIFYQYVLFNDFLKENNLNYIFLKKNKNFGNNVIIYNNNFNLVTFKNFSIDSDELKELFIIKVNNDVKEFQFQFNYFLNYNIFNNNIVEVYKITILLYLYKLN